MEQIEEVGFLALVVVILIHTLLQFPATKNIGMWSIYILVGFGILLALVEGINYLAKFYIKTFKHNRN